MDVINRFTAYLHRNDLRVTPERLLTAREALLSDTHFNAEDLFIRLHSKNAKISRATVYRTLDLLVNSGLLKRSIFNGQIASFEPYMDKPEHGHFICTRCGRIIEFSDPEIEKLHRRLEEQLAVKVINHSHQLYGKCNNCSNQT